MNMYCRVAAISVGVLVFLTACEVKQTKETKLPSVDVDVKDSGNVPEFEVRQTEEGRLPDVDVSARDGQMPEFEVETADVEVGTTEKTVPVPEVDVKTKDMQVTVPDVDIEMPGEEADAASDT